MPTDGRSWMMDVSTGCCHETKNATTVMETRYSTLTARTRKNGINLSLGVTTCASQKGDRGHDCMQLMTFRYNRKSEKNVP